MAMAVEGLGVQTKEGIRTLPVESSSQFPRSWRLEWEWAGAGIARPHCAVVGRCSVSGSGSSRRPRWKQQLHARCMSANKSAV